MVAVGALPFDELKGAEAPLATVLDEGAGFDWAANIISFGALVAITSVVLTILYGQTRIMFAMCRDGLMPRSFAKVNQKTRTPDPDHRDLRRPDRGRRGVRPARRRSSSSSTSARCSRSSW